MQRNDLIRMANQVAQFFDVYPVDRGAIEVAKHLRDFWDPRMRRQLLDYAAAGDPSSDELHPLVRGAVMRLGDVSAPPVRGPAPF